MEFHPHNLGVIICDHVFKGIRPILLVVHDAEGWNFTCGGVDHLDAGDFHNVGVGHLTSRDPSINACADLAVGFVAERARATLQWTLTALSDES